MFYNRIPNEITSNLRLEDIVAYLEHGGWKRSPTTPGDTIEIYALDKGSDDIYHIALPTYPKLIDYSYVMAAAIDGIAEAEGKDIQTILKAVGASKADVA